MIKLSQDKTNYIIIFSIIFFSSDTLLFGTNYDNRFINLGYIFYSLFCILIPLYFFVKRGQFLLRIRAVRITIILTVTLVISFLINRDFRGGYVVAIFFALSALVITELISFHDFCIVYSRIFRLLGTVSCIGFIIFNVVPEWNHYGFMASKSIGGTSFYHYVLYMHCTDAIGAGRNWGIFREPGVYQAYLIIALIIEIYFFEKTNKKSRYAIAVLTAAVLTTKSTTGYIGLVFVLIYALLKWKYLSNYKKIQKIIIGVPIFILLAMFLFINNFEFFRTVWEEIFGKFSRSSAAYVSSYARISSIGTNLYLWLQRPIIGNGVTDKVMLFSDTAMRIYGVANATDTNTLFAQLSMFGIIVGGIWMYAMINMAGKVADNRIEFGILILLFCIILMTEFFVYSPIINLFIWYGLQSRKKKLVL